MTEKKIAQNVGMADFNNWTEVTKGLYRYVIAAGCCYEILILRHYSGTDILTAEAVLYMTGEWTEQFKNNGKPYYDRDELARRPVAACVRAALEDNEENNENLK